MIPTLSGWNQQHLFSHRSVVWTRLCWKTSSLLHWRSAGVVQGWRAGITWRLSCSHVQCLMLAFSCIRRWHCGWNTFTWSFRGTASLPQSMVAGFQASQDNWADTILLFIIYSWTLCDIISVVATVLTRINSHFKESRCDGIYWWRHLWKIWSAVSIFLSQAYPSLATALSYSFVYSRCLINVQDFELWIRCRRRQLCELSWPNRGGEVLAHRRVGSRV